MSIYIYNTLARKKEEFKPQNPSEVKMYTCGVTVYDECHIGHARSLYIFDVIRRYLEYRGYKVRFVRNITDIDDKIINKAKELGISAGEVAEKFAASYREDLKLLGIGMADQEPKATENIQDMTRHIQGLIDKGYAYESGGDVYFSVRKFKDYGKLSGQSLDQIMAGARIEPGENKIDPLDFALWKKSKEEEPFWDSPWGRGRPGWHIECSTMSMKHLNTETLDIHGGGRDLIFPHHENEIAQSEALTGKTFAKYWLHHGLLTINGQKMAKSLGNFVTVKDFINQYRDADILKLFFLSTHYSNPIDYTDEKIGEAKKQKKSFDEFFDKVNSWSSLKSRIKVVSSSEDKNKIDDICIRFEQAMDDDFNTPMALASLFELIDLSLGFISSDKEEIFNYAKLKLGKFFKIFGLTVKSIKIPEEAKKMLEERDNARKIKDFEKADKIREEIKKKFKLIVSDTASSVTLTEI